MSKPLFRAERERFGELLAELIEDVRAEKVDILDISVSDITQSLLDYIAESALFPISPVIDIYFYTSQLLLIKSQWLTGREKQEQPHALTQEIVGILIEFQRIKNLADELKKLHIEDGRMIAREDRKKSVVRYYTAKELPPQDTPRDTRDLLRSIHTLLQKKRIVSSLPKFVHFSLADMHARLLALLREGAIQLDTLIKEGDRKSQLISALLVTLRASLKRVAIIIQKRPFLVVHIHGRNTQT